MTTDMNTNLLDLFASDKEDGSPVIDMCSCSNCGGDFKIADLESKWDSDGWEYPKYEYHVCPICEDGGLIEDYWPSELVDGAETN